jgi:hypothetical protein
MSLSNALRERLERFALVSLEKQNKLSLTVGDAMHELDLDSGKLRFIGGMEFEFQVLGTESDNSLTWLWAWAEEQTEVPEPLLQTSLRIRSWGVKEGLREFTVPSVDLAQADGDVFALISSGAAEASCYFRDAYAGGAAYLLLNDASIDARPSFDRSGLFRAVSELSSRYKLNQRSALSSYLRMKGLSPMENGSDLIFELETGERVAAEFDDTGGLTTVNGASFEA